MNEVPSNARIKTLLKGEFLKKKESDVQSGLEDLAIYLTNLPQDASLESVSSLVRAFSKSAVLKEYKANESIKGPLSVCLANIIRIYAPDTPFKDAELKGIFELFIDQIALLAREGKKDADLKYSYLVLKVISATKAAVLIEKIDSDLTTSLIKTILRTIRDAHSNNTLEDMGEIILAVLADSTDISNEVLEILLSAIPKDAESNTASSTLLEYVIKRAPVSFVRCLTKYFVDTFSTHIMSIEEGQSKKGSQKASDNGKAKKKNKSEKKKQQDIPKFFQTIVGVHNMNPSLMVSVIPYLAQELENGNTNIRFAAVKCISEMAKHTGQKFSSLHQSLFSTYLKRFDDIDPEIRRHMIDQADWIFNSAKPLLSQINGYYAVKLRDPDETVRESAVTSICKVAKFNPTSVSLDVLRELALRMKDTQANIRAEAILGLAKIYQNCCNTWGEEWNDERKTKFEWIPAEIVSLYSIEDAQIQYFVDLCVEEIIVPTESSPQQRANRFIHFANSLNQNAFLCLKTLFEDKKKSQELFKEYLKMKAVQENEGSTFDGLFKKCASGFTNASSAVFKMLVKLHQNADTQFWIDIESLWSPRGDLDELQKQKNKMTYHFIKATEAEKKTLTLVLQRLSIIGFSSNVIEGLVSQLQKLVADEKPTELAFKLVTMLSKLCPSQFRSIIGDVVSLLRDEDEKLVKAGLEILGSAGEGLQEKSMAAVRRDTLNVLSKIVTESPDPDVAKLCAKAIVQVSTDNQLKLMEQLKTEFESGSFTAAVILSYIALHKPPMFETVFEVIEKALQYLNDHRDSNNPSWSFAFILECFKLITNYLRGRKEEDKIYKDQILDCLGKFLEDSSKNQDTATWMGPGYIRERCALSILKLAKTSKYAIPQKLTTLICGLPLRDPCYQSRRSIIDAVIHGLITRKLPAIYFALLSSSVLDPDKQLQLKARKSVLQIGAIPKLDFVAVFDMLSSILVALENFEQGKTKYELVATCVNFTCRAFAVNEAIASKQLEYIRKRYAASIQTKTANEKFKVILEIADTCLRTIFIVKKWTYVGPGQAISGNLETSFTIPDGKAASPIENAYQRFPKEIQLQIDQGVLKEPVPIEEGAHKYAKASKSEKSPQKNRKRLAEIDIKKKKASVKKKRPARKEYDTSDEESDDIDISGSGDEEPEQAEEKGEQESEKRVFNARKRGAEKEPTKKAQAPNKKPKTPLQVSKAQNTQISKAQPEKKPSQTPNSTANPKKRGRPPATKK